MQTSRRNVANSLANSPYRMKTVFLIGIADLKSCKFPMIYRVLAHADISARNNVVIAPWYDPRETATRSPLCPCIRFTQISRTYIAELCQWLSHICRCFGDNKLTRCRLHSTWLGVIIRSIFPSKDLRT